VPARILTPQPSFATAPIVSYPPEGRKRPMSYCAPGVVEEVDDEADVATGECP